MRVASLVVICMLVSALESFSQNGRCWFGADIYAFVKGSIEINSGYAFADNWSIASDISVGYARLQREKDDLGAIHESEFEKLHQK